MGCFQSNGAFGGAVRKGHALRDRRRGGVACGGRPARAFRAAVGMAFGSDGAAAFCSVAGVYRHNDVFTNAVRSTVKNRRSAPYRGIFGILPVVV